MNAHEIDIGIRWIQNVIVMMDILMMLLKIVQLVIFLDVLNVIALVIAPYVRKLNIGFQRITPIVNVIKAFIKLTQIASVAAS